MFIKCKIYTIITLRRGVKKMLEEYEKFGATIKKTSSGSHFIIIPINVINFAGWEEGMDLVVMAKKKIEEVKEE